MTYCNYLFILCLFLVSCKNEVPNEKKEVPQITTPVKVETLEQKLPEKEAPANVNPPQDSKIDTVTVSTLVDLVEKAKSNTVIYLEKGTYSLETDLVYKMTKDERIIIDKKKVETQSIGGQMHFSGLDNFQLIGKRGAIVESENPEAVLLFILNCNNTKVSNLTIRKRMTGKADLCYVSGSNNVEITKCNFDGGGKYGIYASRSEKLTVNNCRITKCTGGAVRIFECKGVEFNNSIFSNNTCTVSIVNIYATGSVITFNNVDIIDNKRDMTTTFQGAEKIFSSNMNFVTLNNCDIRNNSGFTNLGLNPSSLIKTQVEGLNGQ